MARPRRALPLLLLCLALSGTGIRGNEGAWSIKKWDLEDGLPALAVTGLAQSEDGFIWLATRATLTRFDGVGFENFPSTLFMSGPPRGFRAMIQSRRGGLWLAADPNRIVYLGRGAPEVFDMPVEQPVHALAEDATGGLWISYVGGLVVSLKNGRTEVHSFSGDAAGGADPLAFATDQAGRFWFARNGAYGTVGDGKLTPVTTLPAGRPALAPASDGGLWLSAGPRLLKYVGGELREIGRLHPADDAAIERMIEDRNGSLWIGTVNHGLFRHSGERFESIATSDRRIDELLADHEGNIWIGSNGGGLERLQPQGILLEGTSSGLPVEMVQSVCEDTTGTLWAVAGNGTLQRRERDRWLPVTDDHGRFIEGVTCVTAAPDGSVWVASRRDSLLRWHRGRWENVGRTAGLTSRVIHLLFVSRSGEVWVGCDSPDLLYRRRHDTFAPVNLPHPARRFRAMVEDARGDIWVSGERVVFRIRGDQVFDESHHVEPVAKGIRSLFATADGSVWVGFGGGGLGRIRDGAFHRATTANGLADDRVSQLLDDGLGWFWIGSDRGLFKVAQKELAALFSGEASRVRSTYYGRNVGLPSLPAMFGEWPSNARTRDGRLWMPLRTGVAIVDPRRLPQDAGAPAVRLREIRVDGDAVASYGVSWNSPGGIDLARSAGELRLAPGHRRLEFDVTALTFRAPENVQFRYLLEGFDDDWIHGGTQRRVIYPRIPAGRYVFRASASNSDGGWNPVGASIGVHVSPFVWQTWWFRVLAIGSFTGLVAGFVRFWSHRRLRTRLRGLEQQVALDRERARIARDIHDDLGGSLTQIALLSDRALHESATSQPGVTHLGAISTRVQEGIRSLDEIVWAINPSNDTLEHLLDYIAQYAVDFLAVANIRCIVDIPVTLPARVVPAEARHGLFLAVKESLNNVVRHAAATEVTFRGVITPDSVHITLVDNGRGFNGVPHDAYSNGHRNLRQRMAESGGSYRVESAVGQGTTVHLHLGLGSATEKIRTNVP